MARALTYNQGLTATTLNLGGTRIAVDNITTNYSTIPMGVLGDTAYTYNISNASPSITINGSIVGSSYSVYDAVGDGYYSPEMGQRYDVEVAFPVIRSLSTENNVLNMPKLLRIVRRYAASVLQSRIPPVKIAVMRPLTVAMLADMDGTDVIEPAHYVVEPPPVIGPDDIEQVNETMDNATGIMKIHFRYFHRINPKLTMEVNEDLIRHFDREATLERMKSIIKKRHTVRRGSESIYKKPLPMTAIQAQEIKARETLRDMITESEWRRYLTNGFIMVKAPSGLYYQIFASGANTNVYKDNVKVESICIHTDKECPPTDHVINLKVLVEIDEEAVRKGGNVRPILQDTQSQRERLHRGIMNHLQGAANQGVISQVSVDAARERTRKSSQLESLRGTSENLVSIYQRLRTG